MAQFAVKVPIVGYVLAVIEADSLDGAILIANEDEFDVTAAAEDGEGDERLIANVIMIGYKKAEAPDEGALDLVRIAGFSFDN